MSNRSKYGPAPSGRENDLRVRADDSTFDWLKDRTRRSPWRYHNYYAYMALKAFRQMTKDMSDQEILTLMMDTENQ